MPVGPQLTIIYMHCLMIYAPTDIWMNQLHKITKHSSSYNKMKSRGNYFGLINWNFCCWVYTHILYRWFFSSTNSQSAGSTFLERLLLFVHIPDRNQKSLCFGLFQLFDTYWTKWWTNRLWMITIRKKWLASALLFSWRSQRISYQQEINHKLFWFVVFPVKMVVF